MCDGIHHAWTAHVLANIGRNGIRSTSLRVACVCMPMAGYFKSCHGHKYFRGLCCSGGTTGLVSRFESPKSRAIHIYQHLPDWTCDLGSFFGYHENKIPSFYLLRHSQLFYWSHWSRLAPKEHELQRRTMRSPRLRNLEPRWWGLADVSNNSKSK